MKIKKFLLIIYFFIFIALQAVATFLFPEEIYKIYLLLRPFFSYYLFVLIISSASLILFLGIINFKYIFNIIAKDRYFLIFSIILAVSLLIMLFWQPILLRVDKEIMVIGASRGFSLQSLAGLGENPEGRAKALFFFLHYLSFILPLTIKTLAAINSFSVIFQALLIYLILKLLLSHSKIAFGASLLFIFFPGNFLLGVSPEYAVPAQTFALFSIFTLLLFLKFRDKKILIWSLSILALSLLLRLEIIIFLPIYFFIIYRSLDQEFISRPKNTIILILFLAIILPITFQIFLGYATGSFAMATNPIGPAFFAGDNQMVKAMISQHYYPRTYNFTGYTPSGYLRNLWDDLKFNIFYLFKTVPLILVLLAGLPFIKKNRNIQIFYFYFIICFLAASFVYKEYIIDAYHYIAYLIPPLIILTAWVIAHYKFGRFTLGFLFSILIILNLIFFHWPIWLKGSVQAVMRNGGDIGTKIWNDEYGYILKYKNSIDDNSVIISNHGISLIDGIIGDRKNIHIVLAQKDLNKQISLLRRRFENIYFTQGYLSYRNKNLIFDADNWQKIIDENFRYQIIYKYNLGAEIEQNFSIFLYKLLLQ